jgi:hypothetical protein
MNDDCIHSRGPQAARRHRERFVNDKKSMPSRHEDRIGQDGVERGRTTNGIKIEITTRTAGRTRRRYSTSRGPSADEHSTFSSETGASCLLMSASSGAVSVKKTCGCGRGGMAGRRCLPGFASCWKWRTIRSLRCRPRSLAGSRGTSSWQGREHSSATRGEWVAAGHRLGLGRTRPRTVARTSPMASKTRLMAGMEGLRVRRRGWRSECCSCSVSDGRMAPKRARAAYSEPDRDPVP